jgi:hypothetical protein
MFSRPFAYSKHYLSVFINVAFYDAQYAENEFVFPLDTLKHPFIDFTKVVFFKTSRSQIINSQCRSPTFFFYLKGNIETRVSPIDISHDIYNLTLQVSEFCSLCCNSAIVI